jgi:peroxiredoxin
MSQLMKRNLFILIGTVLAVTLLVYGTSRNSKSQTAESAVDGNGQGRVAPNFELKSLDGRTVRLADFRGKVVVVNFWATYCAPCRVETPWLIEFYGQYRTQGLEIIGVSMDDGGAEVNDFVKEMNINYTILMGNQTVGEAYGGTRLLPQSFLVDREGRIVKSMLGIQAKGDLEENIKGLLGGRLFSKTSVKRK